MNLPIHLACRYGCDNSVVEKLLQSNESNINVKNRDGETPIDIAFRSLKCTDEVIKILRKYELKRSIISNRLTIR